MSTWRRGHPALKSYSENLWSYADDIERTAEKLNSINLATVREARALKATAEALNEFLETA
jgi:hypothetical protein